MTIDPSLIRRVQWRLFVAAWIAYAFFHQGGGWNQNARFAMVRAVVEEGRFTVDSYLVYSGVEETAGGPVLVRTPIENAGFSLAGRDQVLEWPGQEGTAVRPAAAGEPLARVDDVASTGDLAWVQPVFAR